MTKSLTKITATALTVALVAGSTLAPTAASAKNGHNRHIAIGAIAGVGGVLLGSHLANRHAHYSGSRYVGYNDHGFSAYGGPRTVRFVSGYDGCFEKPIKRFDRFTREFVIVGTKVVCR